MPPNRFESEVESFLEGSHGDRTHIKRADHHTVTPLCGTLLSKYLKEIFLPLICNNHTGFLAFRMFSAVCCGVWLELSNQKPIRGVVCILLNTNSMYTERYKEWEGFRRSWHCRKIQKFRFSHNAYLLVFGSE